MALIVFSLIVANVKFEDSLDYENSKLLQLCKALDALTM